MRIRFNINYKKALETVLWVLNKRKDEGVNMYNLLKILFHAESLSINEYGRPITGDNYLALQFGTVPESIYHGLIRKDPLFLEFFEIEEVPIISNNNKKYFLRPTREADEDYLSETDKKCLEDGMKEYINLSFEDVKNKNHANPAWEKTYDNSPNSVIDWYDIIKDQNIKNELLGLSKYMVI